MGIMASLDMDDFDIDGLIDDIDIDDAEFIPSKDSSDDEQAPNNKRSEKQTDDLLKNGDVHKPNMNPITTDNFGRYDTEMMNKIGIGIDFDDPMIQNVLDETVMLGLHPDLFNEEDPLRRREQLKKSRPDIADWKNSDVDAPIVDVAEAMSKIELTSMYDQDWHTSKHKDDEIEKEKYKLMKVDELSSMSCVPVSFFGKEDNVQILDDPVTSTDYLRSSTVEYDGKAKKRNNFIPGKIGGDKAIVVCSACGVRLKFNRKKKKKNKYNYVGFKYKRREYIFHDYVCVKLRKLKEAIKDYVFAKEKDEVMNKGKFEDENALINIEMNPSQKENLRMRPTKKTTPRQGDHNYNVDANEQDREASMSSAARSAEDFEWSFHSNEHSEDEEDRNRYRDKKRNIKSFSANEQVSKSEQM